MSFFIFINQERLREENCAFKEFMSPPLLFSLFVHPPTNVHLIQYILCKTTYNFRDYQRTEKERKRVLMRTACMLSYCFNFPVLVLSSSAWCANLDSNEGLLTQSSSMTTILKVSFGNTRLASVWNITECEHPGRILAFWKIGL